MIPVSQLSDCCSHLFYKRYSPERSIGNDRHAIRTIYAPKHSDQLFGVMVANGEQDVSKF